MCKPLSEKTLNTLSKNDLIHLVKVLKKRMILEAKKTRGYITIIQDISNCFSLETWDKDTIVEDIHSEVSEIQSGIKKWHGGTGDKLQ